MAGPIENVRPSAEGRSARSAAFGTPRSRHGARTQPLGLGLPGRGHRRGGGARGGARRRRAARLRLDRGRGAAADARAARAARRRPRRPGRDLLGRGPRSRLPQPRQVLRRHDPRASAGATSTSSTSSSARATSPRCRPRSSGRRARTSRSIPYGGGTSVVGGVEPRIPGSFDGAVSLDLGALDRVLEVDPVSRAARIGAGAVGPAPGGAARRPRADHALLPAVLRALDPRRLDRDARGRALRHRPDARRRPRRGRARDHAERDLGVAAAAGLGRRALARPAAAGLGGDPRRHHRGVGARAAAPVAPRRARRCASRRSWPAPRRCAPSCRPACGPPTAGSSTRSRPRRPARATASARCSCSASSPPTIPSSTTSRARSSSAARTAASPTSPRRGRGRRRVARGLPAHALPARHARAPRGPLGHLRDRDHVGAPARLPRGGRRRDARGAGRALPRDLPLHARLPRRPRALLHRPRAGAPRRRARAVAGDEERRLRRDPRRRRHHHPPSRRRPRPPPVVRRPAPRAVRRRAARGQGAPSTPAACSIRSIPGYSSDP